MAERATVRAVRNAAEENGLCAAVSPRENALCLKYEGHDGIHGWDESKQDTLRELLAVADALKERC